MYYFCTYFDQNYLSRGLALYRSLREHCPAFKLWVLCLDEATHDALSELGLPEIELIALNNFERNDKPLLRAKQNRTQVEYYFTCTPSLPLYIFNHWHEVDLITYLDADVFFFANPTPVFQELGQGSIAIISHRFPPHMKYREKWGKYNVGFLSFRRDSHGIECLNWWRAQCNEWCHDREEDGKFADQKYLDDWPSRFLDVVVLSHKGANLAPWNLSNYHLRHEKSGVLMVDEQRLIFFHFHGLRRINNWMYDPSWIEHDVKSSAVLRKKIYAAYLQALNDGDNTLWQHSNDNRDLRGVRYKMKQQKPSDHLISDKILRLKERFRTVSNFLKRKYIFVIRGHII